MGLEVFEFLSKNTQNEYITALLVFVLLFVLTYIFRKYILEKLKRAAEITPSNFDNLIIKVVESFPPGLYLFVAFYISIQFFLVFPNIIHSILDYTIVILLVIHFVKSVTVAIDFLINDYCSDRTCNPGMMSILPSVGTIIKLFVWIVAIIAVMSNFGIDVTAILTGFGIGSFTFAFAFRKVLSGIFSSIIILTDKPFTVGDGIEIGGEYLGSVKKIGLKTTRIDSINGEIIISNEDMVSLRIKNISHMRKRRDTIEVWISDKTGSEKLREVPKILSKLIHTSKEKVSLERVNLKSIKSDAFLFDVVYYVLDPSFSEYIKVRQELLFDIVEEFRKRKISLAYPIKHVNLTA